jgi:hypothetical protein
LSLYISTFLSLTWTFSNEFIEAHILFDISIVDAAMSMVYMTKAFHLVTQNSLYVLIQLYFLPANLTIQFLDKVLTSGRSPSHKDIDDFLSEFLQGLRLLSLCLSNEMGIKDCVAFGRFFFSLGCSVALIKCSSRKYDQSNDSKNVSS